MEKIAKCEGAEQPKRALLALATGSGKTFIAVNLLDNALSTRRPEKRLQILSANLPALKESLEKGCVVVFDQNRICIRNLPIGG
jgi:superfamily II DNA or RNA helicase